MWIGNHMEDLKGRISETPDTLLDFCAGRRAVQFDSGCGAQFVRFSLSVVSGNRSAAGSARQASHHLLRVMEATGWRSLRYISCRLPANPAWEVRWLRVNSATGCVSAGGHSFGFRPPENHRLGNLLPKWAGLIQRGPKDLKVLST